MCKLANKNMQKIIIFSWRCFIKSGRIVSICWSFMHGSAGFWFAAGRKPASGVLNRWQYIIATNKDEEKVSF